MSRPIGSTYLAYPEAPLREALEAITGQECPVTLRGVYDASELNDDDLEAIQDWIGSSAAPAWATGTGILEAAEHLVQTAVENANIPPRQSSPCVLR